MSIEEAKVIAVVVTYNGSVDIEKCLSSLQASSVPVRIVVVDNQSTDATVEIIQRDFGDIELMVAPENFGFGKGNNIGIKYAYEAGAEFVFLLNQDAFVEPDMVEKLCALQCENPEFGLLSPMQLDGTGEQLDHKFSNHLSKSGRIGEILTEAFLVKDFTSVYEVDFLNAAAWMLSRNCVERVGLFNPVFEHYGEDSEYAHRVWQKGMKVGLSTKSVAYHNRDQVSDDSGFQRRLMMTKALVRCRLCRRIPGVMTNIMSSLSLAVASPGMRLKVQLFFFLLKSMFPTIKMGRQAYIGEKVFFTVTPRFKNSSDV